MKLPVFLLSRIQNCTFRVRSKANFYPSQANRHFLIGVDHDWKTLKKFGKFKSLFRHSGDAGRADREERPLGARLFRERAPGLGKTLNVGSEAERPKSSRPGHEGNFVLRHSFRSPESIDWVPADSNRVEWSFRRLNLIYQFSKRSRTP
jgi:hypothetical protein